MRKRFYIVIALLFFATCSLSAQSVGLVLSGGGAKGLSHIGVIQALEENNIPIDYISGTSMGAIIGGLYAIGYTPQEMIDMLSSRDFSYWSKGVQEREFIPFLYKDQDIPEMMNVSFSIKKNEEGINEGLKLLMPTSLISPYPMDIAVVQLFGAASAAAGNDFGNLMIPFFCVSSDIVLKRPYVSTKGDLGSAIRASMTFPGYFKPIQIDSTLLFDGGFYNNFPWELMEQQHNPDIIIGAKCVKGETKAPAEDNLIEQIESMVMVDTDYDLPPEKGVLVAGEYKYSLMEFDKIHEIVEQGYQNALTFIPELKERIQRESSPEKLRQKRQAFKDKCPTLTFNKVQVEGDLSEPSKSYISRTISGGNDIFSFRQAKRGYYKVIGSRTVQTFYPTAIMNSDSLFTMNIKASTNNFLTLSVGANISSSSLNQGYLGVSHIHLGEYPWRLRLNLNVGQYYTGAGLYWRQEASEKPMVFYEMEFNAHRFDYFSSNQGMIFSNSLSNNVQENEFYFTTNFGTPFVSVRNSLLEIGATMGMNLYRYYENNNYSKYDTRDRTQMLYITPRIKISKATFNHKLYPTLGKRQDFELRYILSSEEHQPGSLTDESTLVEDATRSNFLLRYYLESYNSISDWLSLGYIIDATASTTIEMGDYTSTLLMMPAFQPTTHSKTLLLDNYRASTYLGVALSPIFNILPSFYIHSTFGYFQPLERIERLSGGKYQYSELFPEGGMLASVAAVWQSPIGPVSLSCSYYNKADTKWYPQLNIGLLIFRERGIRN